LFAKGWALEQLWMFWVAPIAGAILGAGVHRLIGDDLRKR
jgi:aquaporin Z